VLSLSSRTTTSDAARMTGSGAVQLVVDTLLAALLTVREHFNEDRHAADCMAVFLLRFSALVSILTDDLHYLLIYF